MATSAVISPQPPNSKPLLPSKSKLNWGTVDLQKQAKLEEKEKQNKRAELILKTWELLVAQDKEEKHAKLKEKVVLQRQLISKLDQHIQHVRKIKQQNAEAASKQGKRKQYIPPVYRPCQRRTSGKHTTNSKTTQPNTTKPLSVKREQETQGQPLLTTTGTTSHQIQPRCTTTSPLLIDERAELPATSNVSPDDISRSIQYSTQLSGDSKIMRMINSANTDQENVNAGSVNQLIQYPENRILRYLGIEQNHHEQIKIEDMWKHMKSHSDKQLRPIQIQLNKLEQSSSPSVKECLQLYNQPTACDYYTGKSIPLSDALKELRNESPPHQQFTLKISKSLASLKSRCGQRMLERSTLLKISDNTDDIKDWFVGLPADTTHQRRPKSAPTINNNNNNKRSPAYNTKKTVPVTIVPPPSPSHIPLHQATTTRPTASDNTEVNRSNSSTSSNWEPLSFTALNDCVSVRNRITSGHGSFRNGRVKLWNQKDSINR